MQQRSIIITAGGTGKRMNNVQPKQFLLLKGKPILMCTLERLHRELPDSQFIITLPEAHLETWKSLCDTHNCTIPHLAISGGEERYHSVKAALAHCTGNMIAVHDGVRPFVSAEVLQRLFDAIKQHNAVIPVIDVRESLRRVAGEYNQAVFRSKFKVVQTPQVFKAEVLRKAYDLPYSPMITDDATLVENAGNAIFLVAGNEENIKITTPQDLAVASWFLGQE